MKNNSTRQKSIAIVGAGLVGTLNAIFLAKKGYNVDVYESRKDLRKQLHAEGRSINLSLSTRGLEALKAAGIEGPVIQNGIPAYGRMIHSKSGARKIMMYGSSGENLVSVNRKKMNEYLLNVAEQFPNVKIHFEHKLTSIRLEEASITITRPDQSTIEIQRDVVLGNDGAYSRIRKEMSKQSWFTCQQEFSAHKYKELYMPAKNGEYPMEEYFVHLWPRQTFMLIALPNKDRSFTCTLLMPSEMYESLKTENDLLAFFSENFPDAFTLIGKKNLVERYFSYPPSSLVSVKCNSYHVQDKVIIMGDAAHAMLPFYAQGMNCAFEDCLIFSDLLDKYNGKFGDVFKDFTLNRCPDAHAICDLSCYNYLEMRSLVNSRVFLAKTYLMKLLHKLMPGTFIPLYHMVAFSRIPYHQVVKKWKWQDKMVNRLVWIAVGISLVSGLFILCRVRNRSGRLT